MVYLYLNKIKIMFLVFIKGYKGSAKRVFKVFVKSKTFAA